MAEPLRDDGGWAAAVIGPAPKHIRFAMDEDKNEFVALLQEAPCQSIKFEKLPSDSVGLLAEALATDKTLRELEIMGSDISDEAARKIAIALEENSTLQVFILNSDMIYLEGMQAIVYGLAKNKALYVFDLSRCGQLSSEGVRAFTLPLAINTTLRELKLPWFVKYPWHFEESTSYLEEMFMSVSGTWGPLTKFEMGGAEMFPYLIRTFLPIRRAKLANWRRPKGEGVTAHLSLLVYFSELGLGGAGLNVIVRSIVLFMETAYKTDIVAEQRRELSVEVSDVLALFHRSRGHPHRRV